MTSTQRQVEWPSKRPVTKLAGPYGHPFHPILVTIPIGAWVLSLVLDIASRVVDDGEALGRAAWWLIGLGLIGAVAAALFGILDYRTIPASTPAKRTGTAHMALNTVTSILFAVSFAIRADDAAVETPIGLIALSAVALCTLGASGWMGGTLSYHYGVRVAEEVDQAEAYEVRGQVGFLEADRVKTGR